MAKLSDLFGRKNDDIGLSRPALRSAAERAAGTDEPPAVETFSDMGSRVGQENEVLRNLLTDTGRKIRDLDELKDSFDKIVAPFNNALRALEQEKSHTLALTGMLDESRTAYETLRNEFYQVEKKATTLEAESEKLRIELDLARETIRAHESTELELSNDISTYRSRTTELEHQLTHETSQHQKLNDSHETLRERFDTVEKHNMEIEGDLAAAREKLVLLEDEKRSLQIAVDKALNEGGRLSHRLTDSDNTLTATRAQLSKIEASLAEITAERDKLSAALDESRERHQAEQSSLNMRLDALQSRAATAERLLTEARQNLLMRTEETRAFDRKSVEATIARNSAEKRLAHFESMHESRERQIRDLEQARAALVERNDGLAKALKARDAALARAEEKIAALTDRNGRLEADIQVGRTTIEKRIEDLNSALQRERMERAMLEGALEGSRKDGSRLQSEVSTLRRGMTGEDVPVAPNEPANDEGSAKGKNAGVG